MYGKTSTFVLHRGLIPNLFLKYIFPNLSWLSNFSVFIDLFLQYSNFLRHPQLKFLWYFYCGQEITGCAVSYITTSWLSFENILTLFGKRHVVFTWSSVHALLLVCQLHHILRSVLNAHSVKFLLLLKL